MAVDSNNFVGSIEIFASNKTKIALKVWNPLLYFMNDFVYALQNIITHSKLGLGYAICWQSFTICIVVNQHFTIRMEIEDVGISYNQQKGDLENGK